MRLGIMQPYFFPYLGYWQLINAVDKYLIYDDVNYIKGGWINRNRILINGSPQYINLRLVGASVNSKITDIYVENEFDWRSKCIKTIEMNYKKAPYFYSVMPFIEKTISSKSPKLADYLTDIIVSVCDYLLIDTQIYRSSETHIATELHGEERVIEICSAFGADTYMNAIGGKDLYDKDRFWNRGIKLEFLKSCPLEYKQFNLTFFDNLSIIDVMMFNSQESIRKMLFNYECI